eukprot:5980851-Pleurochrysis_carterae.AAC.1
MHVGARGAAAERRRFVASPSPPLARKGRYKTHAREVHWKVPALQAGHIALKARCASCRIRSPCHP